MQILSNNYGSLWTRLSSKSLKNNNNTQIKAPYEHITYDNFPCFLRLYDSLFNEQSDNEFIIALLKGFKSVGLVRFFNVFKKSHAHQFLLAAQKTFLVV